MAYKVKFMKVRSAMNRKALKIIHRLYYVCVIALLLYSRVLEPSAWPAARLVIVGISAALIVLTAVLARCPHCGRGVPIKSGEDRCPHCGGSLDGKAGRKDGEGPGDGSEEL